MIASHGYRHENMRIMGTTMHSNPFRWVTWAVTVALLLLELRLEVSVYRISSSSVTSH